MQAASTILARMFRDAVIICRCGDVRGRVKNASPGTVNRVVCYCDDCQAYAHHLKRADLLDAHGGSDIVQVAPGVLSFDRGEDRLVGLRLTPRGLFRWYARCCNTPMGNTLRPTIPFVGIAAAAFGMDGHGADAFFGPPRGVNGTKFAVGGAPASSNWGNLRMAAHLLRLVLGWRLGGRAWPNPFFDRATQRPSRPITVLAPAEREGRSTPAGT
jgi:hypothetical protein